MKLNLIEKENYVLGYMIKHKIIPSTGLYQITHKLVRTYCSVYRKLIGKNHKSLNQPSQIRYEEKLAGRTLIKDLICRGGNHTTIDAGLVYLIENPSFPDYYKVGMTLDIKGRLSHYQTYDPHRKFTIAHYHLVYNRRLAEKKILNSFSVDVEKGEWIKKIDVDKFLEIINTVETN